MKSRKAKKLQFYLVPCAYVVDTLVYEFQIVINWARNKAAVVQNETNENLNFKTQNTENKMWSVLWVRKSYSIHGPCNMVDDSIG